MKGMVMVFAMLVACTAHSRCVVYESSRGMPYVCYHGKKLERNMYGLVWKGTRSCFLSRAPCCAHNADHYGRFRSLRAARRGLHYCNDDLPLFWGDYD